MKKIFGIIVDILTFSVFLVLVLIILSRVKMMISGKEYFDVFGYSVFNVATGSMEPAISQNDIIIVKEQKSYELNDIVTFKSDNAYVTHRVISKSGNNIVTQGDANNAKDVSIKQEDIIGKVVKVIKQGGVWQQIFTSPTIIIMIFITLMLFDFAFSYRGNKEDEKVEVKEVIKVKEEVKDPIVVEEKKKERRERKKINIKEKLDDGVKRTKVKIEEVKKKTEEIKKKKEEKKKLKEEEKKNKKTEQPKLSDKEVVDLYKKGEIKTEVADNVPEEDDDDPFGYTVRLDLSELQKRINEKMNEDEDEDEDEDE